MSGSKITGNILVKSRKNIINDDMTGQGDEMQIRSLKKKIYKLRELNMKTEQSKLESIISEIKEAEEKKEIKDVLEDMEKETVVIAIEGEMDGLSEGETELALEKIEINQEAKERREMREKFIKYSKEIYKTGKDYEMVYSHFEPSGAEGRDFNQEVDLFLERRKEDIDYKPTFTYPEMDKLDIQKAENDLESLKTIEKNVENETNQNVRNIVLEMIVVVKAKISILLEIKKGNSEKAFENAKIAYGDIDDQICQKAEKYHRKKIEFLKRNREKGIVKSELEETIFNAEDIKEYFDLALDKGNLRYDNLEVIIDKGVTAIDVRPSDPNYDHPVILIPPDRKVNGVELIQLVAHEIGCHVVQNHYNHKLGLEGLSFGRDWETAQEGFAVRSEARIKKAIFGDSAVDFEYDVNRAYYILAMQKIKKGADFGEVYDHIFNLWKEEFLAEGDNEEKSEEKASEETKRILRRVIRGMYPYYFPKDRAYFEGEFMALEIEKEGVDKYPRQSRVDPALTSDMIEIGVYPRSYTYEKELEAATNVADRIWQDKGWPVDYLKDKKSAKKIR